MLWARRIAGYPATLVPIILSNAATLYSFS
jgi:hypothetical protein